MGLNKSKKNIALRRKFHILRSLNASKSQSQVKTKSVLMETFMYIYLLKNKLESVKREYSNLLAMKKQCLNILKNVQVPKEVKVEKTKEGFFAVRVKCEKREDTLVSVLQVLEELGLHVLQAKVSCNDKSFSMEATTISLNQNNEKENLSAKEITEAIAKATEKAFHVTQK